MDTRQFLERVLPSNGTDYYAASALKGNLQQTRLGGIDALIAHAKTNPRKDVYFAAGSFCGRRDIKSAELKKALYMDLDCGEGVNKYKTKRDAIQALTQFCHEHFLPPSIVVDSGGGVHAYWTLDAPIHVAKWRVLADSLKQLAASTGFVIDPVVTADAARFLRMPGTINFKGDAPRATKIFHASAKDYTLAALEKKLAVIASRPTLSLAVDNDDLSGGTEARRIYRAEFMVKECPMFSDALVTGGADLPEMLWKQQLHTLAFCEDGEDYIHLVSKGYNGYAFAETQVKWNQSKAAKDRTGPTRCETFAQWSPHCASCPHRGAVNTPVVLGTNRDAALPFPYEQDDNGVFLISESSGPNGEVIKQRVIAFQYPIKNFSVVYDSGSTTIRFTAMAKDSAKNVEMALEDAADRKAATKALASCHVVMGYNEFNNFRNLMSAWVKRMQDTKQTQHSWSQLGWVNNYSGFALAERVLNLEGKEIKNLTPDRNLSGLYKPKGTRDAWIEMAHKLTSQGRFSIDTIVLTAFAAPLMVWLRDPSPAMAFVSTKSGSGKTTAMELAQAVWGNPKTAMNQLDDTQASVFRKITFANNLPVYWDEVRAKEEAAKFLRTIFQLTGGKERSRLTQSIELREAGNWNTMLAVASNESIAEHAIYASQDTEAGRARVFEIVVPPIGADEIDLTLNTQMLGVYENYGRIGEEYGAYLLHNQARVKSLLDRIYLAVSKWQTDTVERFWVSGVSAIICAAMLANQLGYIKTDVAKFQVWMRATFNDQRIDRDNSYGSAESHAYEIITDFISEYRSQIAVYDKFADENNSVGRVYDIPKIGEIVGALAVTEKKIRISKRAFQAWMYNKRIGSTKLLMAAVGIKETMGVIVAGDGRGVVTKQRCYELEFPDGMTSNSQDPFES